MEQDLVVRRNGMTLTGPSKVKRNAYVRVTVSIDDAICERGHDAWMMAVDLAYSVYGAIATEDNTIGQVAQVDGVDGSKANLPVKGRRFSLGLNLYGFKVRELNKRLAAA